MAIGLLLGIALWLVWVKLKTLKPWQRKVFAHTVHAYVFLADTKYYVSIKLKSTTGNPRYFTVGGTLQKNHIKLIKHLIWNTLDIN